MANTLSRIQIVMEANTSRYTNELRKVKKQSRDTFKNIQETAKNTLKIVSGGVALLGASTLKVAGDFEAGMNGVKAVSGATGEDFKKLRDTAKELGSTTAYSATEAAKGMEYLAMAGMNTEQVLKTIPNALSLASAGSIDLASSADILSNIMSGMGIKAEESGRVADVLAQASAKANVNIQMLGDTMKYTAPIAKQLNMSLEETTAITGILGNAGIQGSEAGTALRSIYTRFTTEKKALKHFKQLGISIKDSSGKLKGMTTLITELSNKTNTLKADEKLKIFKDMAGQEAMSALAVSVDAVADDSLPKLIEQLNSADGASKKMADIRMEGLNGSIKSIKSAWEGFLIQLGDAGLLNIATNAITQLAEGIRNVTTELPASVEKFKSFASGVKESISPVISFIQQNQNWLVPLIAGIGAGVIAFKAISTSVLAFKLAMTALPLVLTSGASALALLTSPIGIAVVAISALVAIGVALYRNWDTIKAKATEIFNSLPTPVQEAVTNIKSIFTNLVSVVKDAISVLAPIFKASFTLQVAIVKTAFSAIKSVITSSWRVIKATTKATITVLASIFNAQFNLIKTIVSTVFNAIKALIKGDINLFKTIIRNGLLNTVNIVKTMASNIKGAFSGLSKKMLSIGADIVNGLIQGIKARISGAVSVAKDLASSVYSTVKEWMIIRSPSRKMKPLGRDTVRGYAKGIKKTIPEAVKQARRLAKETYEAVKAKIAEYHKEIKLFGNNTELAQLNYEMQFGSLKRASQADKQRLVTLVKQYEALERQKKVQDSLNKEREKQKRLLKEQIKKEASIKKQQFDTFNNLLNTFKTSDEKRLDTLREQLTIIKEMESISNKVSLNSKALSSLTNLSKYSPVYQPNDDYQAKNNLLKIKSNSLQSGLEYQTKLNQLNSLKANATQEQHEAIQLSITKLEETYSKKRIQIAKDEAEAHKALFKEKLGLAGSVYSSLSSLVKRYAGENSKSYKAMFAIQKAHTLATTLLASKEAIAKAWASAPFPQNLGAVAMATVKTGLLQSAIKAIQPVGQAHSGIANVPKEGTWILDKGERVVKPRDNQKLTKFLDNQNTNKSNQANNIITNVTVNSDGSSDVSSNQKLGKELGHMINTAIQKTLIREKRQGGLLA